MQSWEKIGLIFTANSQYDWMRTHASVPIAVPFHNNLYKVYFSTRNDIDESNIGWIVIDINNPQKILELSSKPLLNLGKPGFFDENGIMATSINVVNQEIFLYYIGWNRANNVPFRNAIGLAVSKDDGISFQKLSNGPILDRSIYDPCFVASNHVLFDNDKFKMWYLSCEKWIKDNHIWIPYYNIKYAESNDGIIWNREGKVSINFKNKKEHAISVPRVFKENNIYKMWYSYRGESYRIGYAESNDGVEWRRMDDQISLDKSKNDWDTDMQCYPFIFKHKSNLYMLYNGNGYGKSGIALAVLK